MRILRRMADVRYDNSLSTRLRRRRATLFRDLISSLNRPLSILDVGGTPLFWEKMGFAEEGGVKIVLLNPDEHELARREAELTRPDLTLMTGDARDLREFEDKQFDVVFSNSVIEHVGSYEDQHRMAEEVRRVGKRYFVQTPNRFFPIEPHFLFPLFQFLPQSLKVFLIRHFDIGWFERTFDKQEATKIAGSIRLLTETEVRELFPGGTIHKEKFSGLTKSFMVYDGWGKEMDV